MKIWISLLSRAFAEGLLQIWRNKFLSFSTLFLGAVIVFLLNFVFALQFYVHFSFQNLESRADFLVKMRPDADSFDFQSLQNELSAYRVSVSVQKNIEPIPDLLSIRFLDLRDVAPVFELLKNPRYDRVIGPWNGKREREFVFIIDNLLKLRQGIDAASLWLSLIFISGGILLLLNTFRLVLFSRKEDIYVARLTGADIRFITFPFLVEGGFLAVLSVFFSFFLFVIVLREVSFFPRGDIFLHFWNHILVWEILISFFVGILGSWIAVKRYLTGSFSG